MALVLRQGTHKDIPALRLLWKEAFGDTDAFLDTFFSLAFSPERCFVGEEGDKVAGAMYLFPCTCRGQSLSYVYAVATAKSHRGRGIATELLEYTARQREKAGDRALILVPGSRELVRFYANRGFVPCAPQGRLRARSGGVRVPLKPLSPRRYGELRLGLLPSDGVVQEGVSLDFLGENVRLYGGKDLLLAAYVDDTGMVQGVELLCQDPVKLCPGILKSLGAEEGIFRVPYEKGRPYALFRPMPSWEGDSPAYFAFSFD